ncbi:MAG: putative capsid protein [Cressdnaviricota sp.]|nr:MAG: putative capsid protein [Cressdnaviricota sp.]
MAKRSYSRKGNKIQPAVQTMTFVTPGSGAATAFIDLSQIASILNRRFYRQGINWAVAGFKVTSLQPGNITISKLPNTWVMSNSWEKSFRTWTKMNNEALAESQSVRPKFLDFKIYADSAHHQLGFGANLLPYSVPANGVAEVATAGEWESSKASIPLVSPAGTFQPGETVEREFIATGASYPGASAATGFDALSLIEGYAASRGLPNIADPNTPSDAPDIGGGTPENWMQAIFNEGTDQASDVLEDMITENNQAPYPFENGDDGTGGAFTDTMYPGGANQLTGLEWHDFGQIYATSDTTNVGITRLKGGNFPCGLIRLDWAPSGEAANLILQIDLIPGNHRGYLCEPMTEM